MRRGQAFEVFRLLIAAVIAGAILMVLLNVLGGLTITTQDPDDFVKQAVKSMASEGGAKTSNTIVFKKGMMVNLYAAADAAVIDHSCIGAVKNNTNWSCSDGICTYDGAKKRGYIQVICNSPDSSGVGDCTGSATGTSFNSSTCPIACCVEFHNASG